MKKRSDFNIGKLNFKFISKFLISSLFPNDYVLERNSNKYIFEQIDDFEKINRCEYVDPNNHFQIVKCLSEVYAEAQKTSLNFVTVRQWLDWYMVINIEAIEPKRFYDFYNFDEGMANPMQNYDYVNEVLSDYVANVSPISEDLITKIHFYLIKHLTPEYECSISNLISMIGDYNNLKYDSDELKIEMAKKINHHILENFCSKLNCSFLSPAENLTAMKLISKLRDVTFEECVLIPSFEISEMLFKNDYRKFDLLEPSEPSIWKMEQEKLLNILEPKLEQFYEIKYLKEGKKIEQSLLNDYKKPNALMTSSFNVNNENEIINRITNIYLEAQSLGLGHITVEQWLDWYSVVNIYDIDPNIYYKFLNNSLVSGHPMKNYDIVNNQLMKYVAVATPTTMLNLHKLIADNNSAKQLRMVHELILDYNLVNDDYEMKNEIAEELNELCQELFSNDYKLNNSIENSVNLIIMKLLMGLEEITEYEEVMVPSLKNQNNMFDDVDYDDVNLVSSLKSGGRWFAETNFLCEKHLNKKVAEMYYLRTKNKEFQNEGLKFKIEESVLSKKKENNKKLILTKQVRTR